MQKNTDKTRLEPLPGRLRLGRPPKNPADNRRSVGYLAMVTCESPFVEAFEYWLDRSRDALRRCNATGVVMVNYPVAMFKSP